jgi:hypothetical protein
MGAIYGQPFTRVMAGSLVGMSKEWVNGFFVEVQNVERQNV